MSPYDDPHVSAREIADYLDHLRLEATPSSQPDVPQLRLLVLLLNKHVNHTYSHYQAENYLDSYPNNLEPCIHNMSYFTCIGQTWQPK
jgi:hypothetical protein